VPLQAVCRNSVRLRCASLAACDTLRGDLEQPREVVALELLARLLERRKFALLVLDACCTSATGISGVLHSAADCSITL